MHIDLRDKRKLAIRASGEGCSRQREQSVQRPEAGLYLACFRNSKKSRLISEESSGRSRRFEIKKITRTRSPRALQAP